MDKKILTTQLGVLIENGNLDFLIDPIEDALVKKSNPITKQNEVYLNSIRAINTYINEKHLQLLRYQLVNLQSDRM